MPFVHQLSLWRQMIHWVVLGFFLVACVFVYCVFVYCLCIHSICVLCSFTIIHSWHYSDRIDSARSPIRGLVWNATSRCQLFELYWLRCLQIVHFIPRSSLLHPREKSHDLHFTLPSSPLKQTPLTFSLWPLSTSSSRVEVISHSVG